MDISLPGETDVKAGSPTSLVRLEPDRHLSARLRHSKVVCSTLIHEGNQIMLVQQGRGAKRGQWNLPGGKLDPGESLVGAAMRETLEETGHHVKIQHLQGIFHYLNKSGKPTLRCVFNAAITRGESYCDGDEIIAVRWFALPLVEAMGDWQLTHPALIRSVVRDLR